MLLFHILSENGFLHFFCVFKTNSICLEIVKQLIVNDIYAQNVKYFVFVEKIVVQLDQFNRGALKMPYCSIRQLQ